MKCAEMSPDEPASAPAALESVVHLGDAALALEHPRALEFDLHGSEALEQPAPMAEEHATKQRAELRQADRAENDESRPCGRLANRVIGRRREDL